jgi:hypothetical protein
MRVLPLLVLALLLAGCSSKAPAAAPVAPDPLAAGPDAAAPANVTQQVLRFAGGDREASLAVDESVAATDTCIFTSATCTPHTVDLTALVPTDVPVELSVNLAAPNTVYAYVYGDDGVSVVQYSSDRQGGGWSIDVLVVRGGEGTVQLVLYQYYPSAQSGGQPSAVTGTAHSAVRSSLVPADVPVSVDLGPGDVVNATGDIEQFVAFPPSGPALRDLTYPFGIAIPAGAPTGRWTLFALADEAVRLTGPDRTLVAHRLAYSETEPVDLASGQEATWAMPVDRLPVDVGVVILSKDTVPDCCAAAAFMGSSRVALTSPGNVQVITDQDDCIPFVSCNFLVLGSSSTWRSAGFLDEHLVPGTYTASVTADQANGFQAYSWALTVL